MDYKADKAALENKVNTTTFDTTFTMLDEGLREALQKMDDYMNEEMALKNALKQLSCDMKEKMDSDAFKAMQNYLGTFCYTLFSLLPCRVRCLFACLFYRLFICLSVRLLGCLIICLFACFVFHLSFFVMC